MNWIEQLKTQNLHEIYHIFCSQLFYSFYCGASTPVVHVDEPQSKHQGQEWPWWFQLPGCLAVSSVMDNKKLEVQDKFTVQIVGVEVLLVLCLVYFNSNGSKNEMSQIKWVKKRTKKKKSKKLFVLRSIFCVSVSLFLSSDEPAASGHEIPPQLAWCRPCDWYPNCNGGPWSRPSLVCRPAAQQAPPQWQWS